MIKHNSGEVEIKPYKKAASTVFAFNDVVTKDSSGYLVRATRTTPRNQLLGLIQADVLATDSDYAANTSVPVEIFQTEATFRATVDTGTAVQAMVGKKFDLNDHNGVDLTSNVQKSVKVTAVISTTEILCEFVTDTDTFKLVSYQQTITRAEFTDGGSTAGTKDLNVTIPAGSVFLRSLITAITGFIGDTSAVAIIGVTGGDTDRYNTGTPSVFTTAAAGVDAGAPSGTAWHTADAVPTVLVTSGADFTNVSAGQMTVTLFWLQPTAD